MKTAVIGVSDMHINSTVALCPPLINLDDGGTYRASRTQRAIGEAWLDFWQEMSKLKVDRYIVIIAGDIGELDTKRRSTQLITINKANVLEMIIDTLEPMLELADQVIVIRGTKAHTGSSAWLEEAIANDLDTAYHDNGAASWWQFQGVIDGVRFDVSHHAPMGRLPWTEKNAAIKIATVALWRYFIEMRQKPPHLIWRAHNHWVASSGDNFEDTLALCMRCWSSKTEFVYRIGQENSVPHIGGIYAICENGSYHYDKIIYKPLKARRVWSIKL